MKKMLVRHFYLHVSLISAIMKVNISCKLLCLIAGVILLSPRLEATHLMGYDLTYICVPDDDVSLCDPNGASCTYRVFLNRYLDCEGSAAFVPPPNQIPPSPDADFNVLGNGPGCQAPIAVGPWRSISYAEVTPVCATEITACRTMPFGQNRPINGTMETRYSRDYDFCSVNCNRYRLTWRDNARNSIITSGASNEWIYAGSSVIDLGITPCNSSPQFATTPIPFICAGQNFTFSQGAYDPDGDSLSFALSSCFSNAGTPVTYDPGYSALAPLGPSWNVSISPRTGDITMQANTGNVVIGVLCVTVSEWRDQVKIGEVSRDIQVTVVNCGANNLPTIAGISNPVNATQTGPLQLESCAGERLCFNVSAADLDPTDNLSLTVANMAVLDPNGQLINPVGVPVPALTGTGANPPRGTVCFTPPIPGNYYVILDVRDDNCPLLGTSQVTVEVRADFCGIVPSVGANRTSTSSIGAPPVDCYTVEFLIEPNACDIPYFYEIDPGDNSPIYTDSAEGVTRIYHTYPRTLGSVMYTYSMIIIDSLGFRFDTTATVLIENNAVADAGPDLTLCPNIPNRIGLPGLPGYRYQWSSCRTVGNPGLPPSPLNEEPQPVVKLDNQRNTPLNIRYCLLAIDSLGCRAADSVMVTFAPKPKADFVINGGLPEACVDEQITFLYVGLRPPGIEYIWDFSSTPNGPNNPIGPGAHFASWPVIGSPDVRLQVVVEGCSSDVVTHFVEIKPIPVASFSAPDRVCEGQSAVVSFNGSASSQAIGVWTIDGGTIVAGDPNGIDPLAIQWASAGPKIITLTVFDRDCVSDEFRDTIDVKDIPEATFDVLSPVCQNDSMRVTYTGSASASGSYIWEFDGAASAPAFNGQQGPYNVTWNRPGPKTVCLQVQEFGCVSSKICKPVTVLKAPEASIAPVSDICFNKGRNSVQFQYTGTSSVDTYDWHFGPTTSQATSSNQNPGPRSYSSPGTKTTYLVVTKDGCKSDTASVRFDVLNDPEAQFAALTNGTVCPGDSVTYQRTAIAASIAETYQWNFGKDAVPASSNLEFPGPVVYASGGSKVVTLTVRHGPGCQDQYALQIRVEASPAFDAGPDVRYCEGTGGVQLNGTTSGGVAGYTWNWSCDRGALCGLSSNIVEDPLVNPTGVGPDTITFNGYAVDARGCKSNVQPVQVIIDQKRLTDAGPDIQLCEGGPGTNITGGMHANNRAPGPFTWEWKDDNGNTPPAGMTNYQQPVVYARPTQTTIYTLIAVDQSTGCTSEATTVDPRSTVTVRVLPRPVADAGPDTVVCFGDRMMLRGAASQGQGNYSYQWSPDNPLVGFMNDPTLAEPTIGPSQTITYSLVVSSSGCTSTSDEVEVIVQAIPTVTAGTDKVLCAGDSVQLDGNGDRGGYRYEWTPITGLSDPNIPNPMASPFSDQRYKLKIISAYGCGSELDSMDLTVNAKPVVEILTPDTVICEGEVVRLAGRHSYLGFPSPGANVIYEWTPGAAIQGDNTAPVAIARPTKTTEFLLTTSLGACSTTESIMIDVLPGIEVELMASDTVICSGEALRLQASGGLGNARFTWSPALGIAEPNAANTLAEPTASTRYRVTMAEGACKASEEVFIKVNQTPIADYFSSETEGCIGLEVSFMQQAQYGISYVWDFGDGSDMSNLEDPVHRFELPGSYPVTLRAIGEGGCENSITKTNINISKGAKAAFVSFPTTSDEIYLPNAEVQFLDDSERASTYLWDFGDGHASTEKEPIHVYQKAGEYEVTLTVQDTLGCISTTSLGLYKVLEPGLTIPNVFTPNGDGRNDRFQVLYEGNENYQVEVFDRWGKHYFTSSNPDNHWPGLTPKGAQASEGVYFYTVTVGGKAYTGNVTLLR
ncbi:MAG: PKD domain-containing protein [Bacteroidia bacterium]